MRNERCRHGIGVDEFDTNVSQPRFNVVYFDERLDAEVAQAHGQNVAVEALLEFFDVDLDAGGQVSLFLGKREEG